MKSKIKTNYSLKNLNTIRIGGHALYYATPSTVFELKEILNFSIDRNLMFYILGNGSNVLISDEDFKGIVIKLCGTFKEIIFHEDDDTVTCGCRGSFDESWGVRSLSGVMQDVHIWG